MFKTIEECRLDLVAYTAGCGATTVKDGERTWLAPDMDFMPCSAARVSFGNEDKTGSDVEKDKKLMKYLAEHQHMTPFEYQHATFLIEVPLFIRSQIHRHRAFSYNEISRRYTDENIEFWIPTTVRGQSKSNKQASDGLIEEQDDAKQEYIRLAGICQEYYNAMLEYGVAREQARAMLPQSLLTKFYMGGNLRSWAHFIELRRDEHAQYEVQVVANRIAESLRQLWPNSCEALGI